MLSLAYHRVRVLTASVHDAPLTRLGRKQSAELYEETKDTVQKTAELIVSSGLRRPLSTMIIGYADLRKKLEAEGKSVIVLPQLQEVSNSDLSSANIETEVYGRSVQRSPVRYWISK